MSPHGAFLVAQMVNNLPATQETRVLSLGQEDPLGREWQPTLVFLPGESYGKKSLEGYNSWSRKESVGHDWVTNTTNGNMWYYIWHLRLLT